MGLFKKIFGKKDTAKEVKVAAPAAKEEKAEVKAEAPIEKKAAPKAEVKAEAPAEKKAAPKAEVKTEAPAEKKAAPKAEVKAEAPAEKKAAPKAEVKAEAPAEKKAAPKAEVKAEAPAEKKAAPKAKKPAEKKPAPAATPKVEEPAADEVGADQTDEEIDAAFAQKESAEVSAEVAQAEAKSGRALARFEIKKSKDNRFVFNLYAPNRVIVATSQIYASSPSAVNGIKSIMVNAPKAPVEDTTLKTFDTLGFPKWEIYTDKGGQFRFRLFAPNGSCIVHSQGYTTKASCKNGIASIVKNAPDAIIDKSYLKKDKE